MTTASLNPLPSYAGEKRTLLPGDLKPVRSLEDYMAQGGMKGFHKARAMKPQDVIVEIGNAKLRGRGGAGFPTAIKWEGVRSDPCENKYLVCNGSEGEPGTYKDRYLLSKNPYPLIEGLLIAAYAIGVKQAVIGLKKKFKIQHENINRAITEVTKAGFLSDGFIRVVSGPDEYLFGEERGLLEFIDNGGALPRIMPTYMQGLYFTPISYNPTVVNNVETLSHAAHILAKGAGWFQSAGSTDTPGTMIFTLCGDVKNPGMYELPLGMTLRDLIDKVGGGPVGRYPVKAVFSGVANRVITPDQFDTPLDFGSMKKMGSGLGSGGFIVYDESVCMVKVAWMFSNFLATESCGQCVPCKTGSKNITEHLKRIEQGQGNEKDIEDILDECGKVTSQTRCFLSNEEAIVTSSIVNRFRNEFTAHFGKSCPLPRKIVLPQIADFNEITRTFTFDSKYEPC